VRFVLKNLLYMAPVILFAVVLSASIRASGADTLLARAFKGNMAKMIFLASLFGAITPICGVGVLPIIAGLLSAGVPLAPIMAFWLSSPITDPPMLAITAGTLGIDFAVAKTSVAVAAGLIGGFATETLLRRGFFDRPLRGQALSGDKDEPACEPLGVSWRFWTEPGRRELFLLDARQSGLLILKWLTIAFALESLVRGYLPPELIASHVGADSGWAIPLAVTVGIPIYLDGYAALPLVRGLMDLGMTPGAAMAFLVAGGITSLYASVAVFALVRIPVFVCYLALAVIVSAIGGYAFEAYVAMVS
jgi:uncharacterized membrane protein YraQ (UPF0718 family)